MYPREVIMLTVSVIVQDLTAMETRFQPHSLTYSTLPKEVTLLEFSAGTEPTAHGCSLHDTLQFWRRVSFRIS